MKSIQFIQYLRPDGRKQMIDIDRPDDMVSKAEEIEDQGFRFEAEVLTTGQVSLTIFDPNEEDDVCIEIVKNGPGVGDAVDRLIEEFANLKSV